MRLVPYASLRSSIPALTLIAVNVSSMLGPKAQLALVALTLCLAASHLVIDLKSSWPLLGFVGISIILSIMTYGLGESVIKGSKLILFCLVSALTIKGASDDNRFPQLLALRAFLILCFFNVLFAVGTGNEIFRGAYLIEFSIYSSYTIAILVHLARPRLTIYDRIFAYGFCVLCGSTTGLFVLILGEFIGRKLRPLTIAFSAIALPIGVVALHFLFEARDKELTWTYLVNSDRGVIFTTFFETVTPRFSFSNWLFGVGVGTPLEHFKSPDPVFDLYLARVGDGAIHANSLHNEPMRILCDYGLVGLLLVVLRLWKRCSWTVLVLLGVSMVTNSYLYSFSGALIASGLFNSHSAPLRHNNEAQVPTEHNCRNSRPQLC